MEKDRVPQKFNIITDTSDFFRLEYNDILVLSDSNIFWVKRYEKEGRFGLDDEPKYWVRRAIELIDDSTSSKVLHHATNCAVMVVE